LQGGSKEEKIGCFARGKGEEDNGVLGGFQQSATSKEHKINRGKEEMGVNGFPKVATHIFGQVVGKEGGKKT